MYRRSVGDRLVLTLLRLANRAFPEGRVKNRLRSALFSIRGAVPRELMVGRGECAVQVGMNLMRNIARISKFVGETARVVIVEANESTANDIKQFMAAHSIENITVIAKGAWKEKGQFKFLIATSRGVDRLDVKDIMMPVETKGRPYMSRQVIEVDTIDNMMREVGVEAIDYIEITVNGAELQVLQGMEHMLKKTTRLFIAGRARSRQTGEAMNVKIASFLQRRGFSTKIARGSKQMRSWGKGAGDVVAWKDH